jgi:small redox-active disulfide protein 2
MKTIQILGSGCAKCQQLAEHAETAAKALGLEYRIEKVTNAAQIAEFGVMLTPGLAVDGELKSFGRVLSADKIRPLLEE